MAYETAKWNCVIPCVGDAPKLWIGRGTDVHTDADEADFIEDGDAKGMKVNDVVIYVNESAPKGATNHVITAVTEGGAATMSPAILA